MKNIKFSLFIFILFIGCIVRSYSNVDPVDVGQIIADHQAGKFIPEKVFHTAAYTVSQYALQRYQAQLIVIQVTNIDSAIVTTPVWSNYFDASLYTNAYDSVLIAALVKDSGTDSVLIQRVGTTDQSLLTVSVIDTIVTNKSTLIQRSILPASQPKYGFITFPYWSFQITGVACTNATAYLYILNIPGTIPK